ncbi:hypothetical protein WICMUC_002700 [Wickerhamomyces mucosus]|uniref:Uncharacterized protein n=1 Tax=Wickerhamomyces mucosus TaxID=1378264 RepID=A0A9P8PQI8_9ASCO|nr:hypothetical protein WICMUC_002700 [Wickerhamomyces mucosus]
MYMAVRPAASLESLAPDISDVLNLSNASKDSRTLPLEINHLGLSGGNKTRAPQINGGTQDDPIISLHDNEPERPTKALLKTDPRQTPKAMKVCHNINTAPLETAGELSAV